MAVQVKYSLCVDISSLPFGGFKSGVIQNTVTFKEAVGVTLTVADATSDLPISLNHVDRVQMLFMWSDQPVIVKLITPGGNLASTPGFELLPNVPSLLSVKNIVEMYVTNGSGQQATVILQGAGVTT